METAAGEGFQLIHSEKQHLFVNPLEVIGNILERFDLQVLQQFVTFFQQLSSYYISFSMLNSAEDHKYQYSSWPHTITKLFQS